MRKRSAAFFALWAAFVPFAVFPSPAVWFRSDAAGIAYESLAEAAALRGEWALSVELDGSAGGARTETKKLFARGELRRIVVSALYPDGFPETVETRYSDGLARTECYDSRRRLIEETSAEESGEGTRIEYRWEGPLLLSASGFALGDGTGSALWTDSYRYSRSGALLSVERSPAGSVFSQESRNGLPRSVSIRGSDGTLSTTRFDQDGREAETVRLSSDGKTELSSERVSYAKVEPNAPAGASRRLKSADGSYSEVLTDEKGRVVRETRFGKDEKPIEETRIVWKGDRIASRTTERGGETTVAEFSYDSRGDRVAERDYRNGILERSVSKEGAMETETLYKKGAAVLRAVYENGERVSEERLR